MSPKTALEIGVRQFLESLPIRVVVYAIALGAAWATLQAEVAKKADATDVITMHRDIRDIKILICRHEPKDSYCMPEPQK